MVDQSVEHAIEDLTVRRWIDARLKADALVSATRQGLKECAGELGEEETARVATALQTEDPSSHAGDVRRLQDACAALDAATRGMADLLMDKVSEALLRKRGAIS